MSLEDGEDGQTCDIEEWRLEQRMTPAEAIAFASDAQQQQQQKKTSSDTEDGAGNLVSMSQPELPEVRSSRSSQPQLQNQPKSDTGKEKEDEEAFMRVLSDPGQDTLMALDPSTQLRYRAWESARVNHAAAASATVAAAVAATAVGRPGTDSPDQAAPESKSNDLPQGPPLSLSPSPQPQDDWEER
jgi:hypothetical protein